MKNEKLQKFYKEVDFSSNPKRRKELEDKFDEHKYQLIDLTISVAKNFNTIFRIIRKDIDSNFLSQVGIIPKLHGTNLI